MGTIATNGSNQILENKTREFIPFVKLYATGRTKNELLQRIFRNKCHGCTSTF